MEFFTNNKKFSHPSWKSYLFRYHVIAKGPRPESYREDVECAEHISDGKYFLIKNNYSNI